MARLLPTVVAVLPLLWGCGGPSFYEPHPPTLLQTERLVPPNVRTEPTVFLVLFDLHLPDLEQCGAFAESFVSALKTPVQPNPVSSFAMQVNQGCNALSQRAIDVQLVKEKLDWAAAGYPNFAVRPVVVYVNNLDAPEPPNIRQALDQIRALYIGTNDLHPRLWGFTLPSARIDAMEQWIQWTFADDPDLAAHVSAPVSANLPQWSVMKAAERTQLLTFDERSHAVGIRLCSADEDVETDLPTDGTAMPLDGVQAVASLRLAPIVAEVAGAARPANRKVRLELCLDACDRHFTDGDTLGPVWQDAKGCAPSSDSASGKESQP